MSKLSDYSKFDHIDTDDDEDEREPAERRQPQPQPQNVQNQQPHTNAAQASAAPSTVLLRHPDTIHCPNRFVLHHNQGNNSTKVYEWEQTLSDLTMYVGTPLLPQGASQLVCDIQPNRLTIGIRGGPHAFLNEATFGTIDEDNSTWTWEALNNDNASGGGLLTIELSKANKGVVWEAACVGTSARLNPMHLQEERQRLMKERFGEQYAGMDFSQATFNGEAPDPRSFMGGVAYD